MNAPANAPPPAACSTLARDLGPVLPMTPTPGVIRPRWLSPAQLASLWGCSRETVLREIRAGRLPVLKVNGRVYRISEIDAASAYALRYARSSPQLPHLATPPR